MVTLLTSNVYNVNTSCYHVFASGKSSARNANPGAQENLVEFQLIERKSQMARAAAKSARGRLRRPKTRAGPARDTYHHGNLRPALIAAALRILRDDGIGALSLRAAARAAGVSQAAPYRHFADKEGLLAAVAEAGFRALNAAVTKATAGLEGDFINRFRMQGQTYVGFAVAHPAQFRLMFGRELADRSAHPGLRAAAEETFARLLGAVREGQQAGLVRPGDPEDQAMAAWSLVHGLSALLLDGHLAPRGEPLEAFTFRALQYVFLGLRSGSAPV
jgi:AcrR family transcriptional regulator